jgi:DNA-binding MarR family transcriptional regulator
MVDTNPRSHVLDGVLSEERFESYDLRALLSVLRAATRIEADGDAELRREGVDFRLAEFDILAFVYVAGSIRPSEVIQQGSLSISPPTVHNIIKRLEKRGLVERTPHPDDSRGVLVSITDAGRAAIQVTFPIVERKVINRFASHFSAEELLTIAGLLERA